MFSRVKCKGETGVEMEALNACAISSLTIYDMCKAISNEIQIDELKLLGKKGGKKNIGNVEWKNISNNFL